MKRKCTPENKPHLLTGLFGPYEQLLMSTMSEWASARLTKLIVPDMLLKILEQSKSRKAYAIIRAIGPIRAKWANEQVLMSTDKRMSKCSWALMSEWASAHEHYEHVSKCSWALWANEQVLMSTMSDVSKCRSWALSLEMLICHYLDHRAICAQWAGANEHNEPMSTCSWALWANEQVLRALWANEHWSAQC